MLSVWHVLPPPLLLCRHTGFRVWAPFSSIKSFLHFAEERIEFYWEEDWRLNFQLPYWIRYTCTSQKFDLEFAERNVNDIMTSIKTLNFKIGGLKRCTPVWNRSKTIDRYFVPGRLKIDCERPEEFRLMYVASKLGEAGKCENTDVYFRTKWGHSIGIT